SRRSRRSATMWRSRSRCRSSSAPAAAASPWAQRVSNCSVSGCGGVMASPLIGILQNAPGRLQDSNRFSVVKGQRTFVARTAAGKFTGGRGGKALDAAQDLTVGGGGRRWPREDAVILPSGLPRCVFGGRWAVSRGYSRDNRVRERRPLILSSGR